LFHFADLLAVWHQFKLEGFVEFHLAMGNPISLDYTVGV